MNSRSAAGALRKLFGTFAPLLGARSSQALAPLCLACGGRAGQIRNHIITPDIAAGCGFSDALAEAYDEREGLTCRACGASQRASHIAQVLLDLYGYPGCPSLAALCAAPFFAALDVAELNECAQLHQFLRSLPKLRYSEFGSLDPLVSSESVLDMSYRDGTFDLFLTSDTLEHVPDVDRALAEIYRVLKPGGRHIFTVPAVWGRPDTRRRAIIQDGLIVHLMLPPCYHGGSVNPDDCLAFYEYGDDIVDIVRRAGFAVEVHTGGNVAIRTLVTTRL